MDIKTPGKEGDLPLVENMHYLSPKMQWLWTYAWNMNVAETTPWINGPTDYVTVNLLSFSQAMWTNRKGSIHAMQSPKEAVQLQKTTLPSHLAKMSKALDNLATLGAHAIVLFEPTLMANCRSKDYFGDRRWLTTSLDYAYSYLSNSTITELCVGGWAFGQSIAMDKQPN